MPVNFYITSKNNQQSNLEGLSIEQPQETTKATITQTQVTTPTKAVGNMKMMGIMFAVGQVSQTLNTLSSNVGKWTGNSNTQNSINIAKEAIGQTVFAVAHPVMWAMSTALTVGLKMYDNYMEDRFDMTRAIQSSQRAGYRSYNETKGVKH